MVTPSNNAADKPTQLETKLSWVDTPATKIAGAVAGVAATIFTARDAITRAFFKTVNKGNDGAFHDLQNKRDAAISEVVRPAKNGIPVPDALERVRKINHDYELGYRQRRKLLNINGVLDEAKAVKSHQWIEVAFSTATVASIAVGAIIAIASSREAVNKEDRITKDVEGGQRSI